MNFSCIVLISLACLVISSYASPIQIVEAHPAVSKSDLTVTNKLVGRQTAPAAVPAVAVATEEDDDDDEEDDIEDALDDDDDDDEEEGGAADEDDDDDDDYLERFFDDILGDDDDDDDDDVSPSTGIVQQPAQQPSAPTSVAEEVVGADYPAGDVDAVYDDDQQIDDNGVQVLDTAPGDTVKEPSDSIQQAVAAPTSQIGAVNLAAAEEDEDDEEDDIEDALDVDDDDDDDEDDDDDDDDLIGDDVIEARGARALKENTAPVPDILINKYNRFVDGIFGRINKILKRSYDPVSVRLSTSETKTKKTKTTTTTKKRKTTRRTKTSQKSRTSSNQSEISEINPTKNESPRVERDVKEVDQPIAVGIPETFLTTSSKDIPSETRTVSSKKTNEKRVTKRTKTKSKTKQGTKKQAEREGAHGVLYGLSTLTRQGNVRVNAMSDYTTVKTNFVLGPLVLKVEKAFGRGAKRELKSATATTTEMIGRINLRIVNGAATLHSIKVQQPKQVQVDSADNHDKTRKFVWRKSSHIAQVVSQQLTAAARSMLQPPPSTNVE